MSSDENAGPAVVKDIIEGGRQRPTRPPSIASQVQMPGLPRPVRQETEQPAQMATAPNGHRNQPDTSGTWERE